MKQALVTAFQGIAIADFNRVLELTLAFPGGKLWAEMQENARLASERRTGAMQLLVKHAKAAT